MPRCGAIIVDAGVATALGGPACTMDAELYSETCRNHWG
eukprot:CAMPEP_0168360366 /NCGR_PEP_ID=MMETSP0228-20121227/2125_1 /TAXON_ID=133427 /ORGANISM="Protoceratium reticulatum, Strain CCCM 535 (=CCMP 1889)" /LENGTH=38 /DNA_ID= /DNA_START= /DNA_END= /DNA_ORIENTATION=